jgi:glutaredoxin 3
MAKVIIYSTNSCPYCRAAKALFQSKGVSFEEVNVEGDAEKRAWLVKTTGMTTVPQIFIDGKPFGGFDDVSALDRQGKLNALLDL